MEIVFVFRFDVWPGTRTLAFRLLDRGENKSFHIQMTKVCFFSVQSNVSFWRSHNSPVRPVLLARVENIFKILGEKKKFKLNLRKGNYDFL